MAWLEACNIDKEVLRIRTKYLDLEIHLEGGETQDQLTEVRNLIDSIVINGNAKILNTESSAVKTDRAEDLASTEALWSLWATSPEREP